MVDLRAVPFNLDDEGVKWVEDTIASMSLDEKIGQLFINMGSSRTPEYLKSVLDTYHIAGVRYQKANADEIWEQNRCLQDNAKIPLLIAANTEAGGNGAANDGTYVGHEIKIAATNDEKYAYEMGRISGVEAAAIGCNWSFAPIVDLNNNWRNPIISVRTWGQDPDLTLKMSLAYMKGIMEAGIMPAAKHWPGDGIDERDQHLSSAPNWLSIEDWDATFGKLYKGLIDAGLPSIMAGHIALPSYQKKFNPAMTDEDIMPATLSKEITTNLLRDQLGFNGVVVTDASHMVAMTAAMPRREVVPTAIEAGCDLFLFFNDPDEDFGWMKEGLENGLLSEKRFNEALTRTLGLKAKLGLHKRDRADLLPEKEAAMATIGLPESKAMAAEVSDRAITLVKNTDKRFDPLPISVETHKRVLVVPIEGSPNPMAVLSGGVGHPADSFAEKMRERGYEVEVYESISRKAAGKGPEELAKLVMSAYEGKAPIAAITDNYDVVISVAKVDGLMQPIERVYWPSSKGTMDIPWYVHEVPTIFVSFACPNHMPDVPQVKTFINAYDDKDHTQIAVLDKLEGKSEFHGVSPIDAFGGLADSHI